MVGDGRRRPPRGFRQNSNFRQGRNICRLEGAPYLFGMSMLGLCDLRYGLRNREQRGSSLKMDRHQIENSKHILGYLESSPWQCPDLEEMVVLLRPE